MHPALAAEIPGIRLEEDEADIEAALDEENNTPTHEERAQRARRDGGFEETKATEITGVGRETPGVEVIDVDDVIDDADDVMVKVEADEEPVEDDVEKMPELIEGKESDDDDDDEDDDVNKNEKVPLGRGHRVRKNQQCMYRRCITSQKNMKRV